MKKLFLLCVILFFVITSCSKYMPIDVKTSKPIYSAEDTVEITVENTTANNIVCFLSLEKKTSESEWKIVREKARRLPDTTFYVESCEYEYVYNKSKPCIWRTIFLSLVDESTMRTYYNNSVTIQDNLYEMAPLKPVFAIEEFKPGEKRNFVYKIKKKGKLNADVLGLYSVFVWQFKGKTFGYHAGEFEIIQKLETNQKPLN